eukprot:2661452-Prymnesium_polylepis.1
MRVPGHQVNANKRIPDAHKRAEASMCAPARPLPTRNGGPATSAHRSFCALQVAGTREFGHHTADTVSP